MKSRFAFILIWLLCALSAAISLVWLFFAILYPSHRAWQIAIGFDQTTNAAFGGNPDWTISARCWEKRHRQPYKILRAIIDWAAAVMGDTNHCEYSYLKETEICMKKHVR